MKNLWFLLLLCPQMALVGQAPGGAQRQILASAILGTSGDANVAPGSTTTGTDRVAALNAALSRGKRQPDC
jgi:hypothetical protein